VLSAVAWHFGRTTGSGKGGGLNVLMGNLAACRDVIIWAIDLKRGRGHHRGATTVSDGPTIRLISRLARVCT
jgi:hypothetical protein